MSRSDQLVGTRDRLLAAGREEFAAHGMAGARVNRIAERADVSKERIYGYFGSKENLFAAVVSEALNEHAVLLGPPSGDLADFVGRIYDLHQRNPQLLRLMMWEALQYDGDCLPAERQRSIRYQEMVETLAAALGTKPDDRAAGTLLALIGIAVLPSAFPQITRLILGSTADEHTDLRQHLVGLARRMTATPPLPSARAGLSTMPGELER
ncbi:TetR/AcrR family transcriptional regulator [Streptomyces sp. NPDC058439]|uniref:TetR/AcrR family transcriptional regulator n=1 Tax=Streptomyces sp. NPDC058439 TaxID=3346500 RepID=UPI00365A94B7